MASPFPLVSSPSPLPSTSSSNTDDSFNESDTEGSTVTVSLEDGFEDRTIKAVRVDYNEFFELPIQPNTNAKCVQLVDANNVESHTNIPVSSLQFSTC